MELKVNETAVDTEQLTEVLNQNEQLKKDTFEMYQAFMELFTLIGLAESGKIKREVIAEGSIMSEILKEVGGLVFTIGKAQLGWGPAVKELEQKFGFVSKYMPLFIRYADLYSIVPNQIEQPTETKQIVQSKNE